MNKVILRGHLGQDVRFTTFANGNMVANFSVATNRSWNDKAGQKVESTEWHQIVCWGKRGQACANYLRKGSNVMIEGRIQGRTYEAQPKDKTHGPISFGDGTKAVIDYPAFEIVVEDIEFLDKKTTTDAGNAVSGQAVVATAPVAVATAPVAAPAPVVPAPAPVVAAPVDPAAVQETFAPGTESVPPVGV